MNIKFLKSKCWLAFVLGLCLCATSEIHAQQAAQRPAGAGGGFGGFGGFGGGGGSANRSGSTTGSQQYNANGTVGNATISYDPDTHNITIIADKDTTEEITGVISNLDRPQPQVLIKVVFMQVTHSDATDIGVEGGWMKGIGASMTGAVANSFGLSSLGSGTGSNAPVSNVFGMPIQSFSAIAPFTAGHRTSGKGRGAFSSFHSGAEQSAGQRRRGAVRSLDYQCQLQLNLWRADQFRDVYGRGNYSDGDALYYERRVGRDDRRSAGLFH